MRKIVVHQMGKVASSAITKAVSQGIDAPVPHTHHFARKTLTLVAEQHTKRGTEPPQHVRESYEILDWWAKTEDGLDLITIVRDPFARNLSAFFQNIHFHIDDPASKSADEVAATFMERYPHAIPVRWFDQQLRDPLGLDVFKHPFSPAKGHATVDAGRLRLLVLRYESSSALKRRATSDFLGVELPPLAEVNTTSKKKTALLYAELKRNLTFPADFVQPVLDSPYCRHFYSEAERDQMWGRWVEGRPAGL